MERKDRGVNKMNADKINGYGVIFRFITPILVTIALFLLTLVINDVKDIKCSFTNHLEHHRQLEVKLENRLSSIETFLKTGK